MVWYYISLRLKQFWRFFSFNDIHPLIGIPLTALAFSIFSYVLSTRTAYAPWVLAGLGILGISQLQSTSANSFLREKTGKAFVQLKLAENYLISLPFIIAILFLKAWAPAVVLCVLVAPYSLVNIRISRPQVALRSPFLRHGFEFNYGFRVFSGFYIVYMLLLVVGVISGNYYVLLLPFFALLYFTCSFFGFVEDPFYIWLYRSSPMQFLLSKAKTISVNYAITFVPFLLVGLIAYPVHYTIILLSVAIGLLAVWGSMLLKYHFYPSALSAQIAQTIFFGICILSIINPVFIFVVIAFLLFSFYRAQVRLKSILVC